MNLFRQICRAYAAIYFSNTVWLGLLFLILTFVYPNVGLAGSIGALSAVISGKLLNFPESTRSLQIYNALLVGLSLGAVYSINIQLIFLIIGGAVLATLLSGIAVEWLWRLDHLSPLSAPFLISAFITGFAAQSFATLTLFSEPHNALMSFPSDLISAFFIALASAFFVPHKLVGIFIFIGLGLVSPYCASLAIAGFIAGYSVFHYLAGNIHPELVSWIGFNFILTAIAIGGIFTIPSISGFLLAVFSAALSALIASAAQNILIAYGLPIMAIPFLSTSFIILSSLRKRNLNSKPELILESSGLPEHNYERARLARYRGASDHIPHLYPPFLGSWKIYQGTNGQHTHIAPWQYALDFYQEREGKSYLNSGNELTDYFCYGLPVCSPAQCQVINFRDNLADNLPGQTDTQHNWGNYVLLYLTTGQYLLLAHLQQFSVKVKIGEWISVGQVIAACGNSGRSPQPHLHLQVQTQAELGSPTMPFSLTAYALENKLTKPAFKFTGLPSENEIISPIYPHLPLKAALFPLIGRELHYQVVDKNTTATARMITVGVGISGQLQLRSDRSAIANFYDSGTSIAYFGRNTIKDDFLDAWILSMGISPYCAQEIQWEDSPSAALFPLTLFERILLRITRPFINGITSRYQREWDSSSQNWKQSSQHCLTILPGYKKSAEALCIISEDLGVISLSLATPNGVRVAASLTAQGQVGDHGIPTWHCEIPHNTALPSTQRTNSTQITNPVQTTNEVSAIYEHN